MNKIIALVLAGVACVIVANVVFTQTANSQKAPAKAQAVAQQQNEQIVAGDAEAEQAALAAEQATQAEAARMEAIRMEASRAEVAKAQAAKAQPAKATKGQTKPTKAQVQAAKAQAQAAKEVAKTQNKTVRPAATKTTAASPAAAAPASANFAAADAAAAEPFAAFEAAFVANDSFVDVSAAQQQATQDVVETEEVLSPSAPH